MFVIAGAFISVYEDDRALVVRQRGSLGERPDTAVFVARAPDGLPLVLRVDRQSTVAPAVCAALGVKREELPRDVRGALESLEEVVRRHARSSGVSRLDGRAVYVTEARLDALLGDTLLVRALGAESPLILPDDRWQPSSEPERIANTAAVALAAEPAEVMARMGARLHLGVGLDDEPPIVLSDDAASPAPRPLLVEDLRRLPSAAAHWRDGHASDQTVALGDGGRYERAMREALSLAWSVSRQDLAQVVVELGRALAAMHRGGRVHGDVKPANTLVTASQVVAHDPIGVPVGERSPAATPGWSAPEQVLARPVSPATDVYALGLLAARVVEAAIYGEERSFVIPTGGTGRRRMRVLANPDVFLDPTHVRVDDAARVAWQRLLARAVAFEPEARFADGAVFADALAELLERHPIPGRLGLRAGPGRLVRNVDMLGRVQPSWVVSDRR